MSETGRRNPNSSQHCECSIFQEGHMVARPPILPGEEWLSSIKGLDPISSLFPPLSSLHAKDYLNRRSDLPYLHIKISSHTQTLGPFFTVNFCLLLREILTCWTSSRSVFPINRWAWCRIYNPVLVTVWGECALRWRSEEKPVWTYRVISCIYLHSIVC